MGDLGAHEPPPGKGRAADDVLAAARAEVGRGDAALAAAEVATQPRVEAFRNWAPTQGAES